MLPCGIGPTEARTGLCNSTCRSRLWPEAGITGPRAQKGPQDVTEQDRLWCPCSSASCLQLKKPLPQIRALQQSRLLLESQGKDTPPQEVQEAPAGISNRTDTGCVSVSTNDHKPGHLKQQAFTCSRFQRPEVWKQVCTGLHSLQRLEGEGPSCLFSSWDCLQTWRLGPAGYILSISVSVFMWPLTRTLSLDLEPTLIPD